MSRVMNDNRPFFTIFTPTFNRCKSLERTFKSISALKIDNGTERINFEWLIVDDGSTDNTQKEVMRWIKEAKFPIRYFYQVNQGKHVAYNFAVTQANGIMMLDIDSDDCLHPNALVTLFDTWASIPNTIKHRLKGVTGRCFNPETGELIGNPLPRQPLITTPQDLRFKHHIKGEMCGFNRLDILKKHPFPVYDEKSRFCPESIVWFEIGKEYQEYVIDDPIRYYYKDSSIALTKGKSQNRARENYHLWKYEVNDLVWKYIFTSPKDMIKPIIGISMDGFRMNRSIAQILRDCYETKSKIAVLCALPIGWILSKLN